MRGADWAAIKEGRSDHTVDGASLHKPKWCNTMYMIAQDRWLGETKQLNLAVTNLGVGFVRVTCSRSGAMGKDWFDRAGLTPYWVGRNVLSVRDFQWDKDYYW